MGNIFSKTVGWPNFPEILESNIDNIPDLNTLFIASIMPRHIKNYEDSILSKIDSFKIKLIRKDKIAQITSLYISTLVNNFQHYHHENVKEYFLPIDIKLIDSQIRTMKELNSLADQANIRYNIEITYEDIKPMLDLSDFKEFVKPNNWNEIYSTVQERYNY